MSDRAVITSVSVEERPRHDRIHVWNRGGLAGTLVVEKGDGACIARMLMPSPDIRAGETNG